MMDRLVLLREGTAGYLLDPLYGLICEYIGAILILIGGDDVPWLIEDATVQVLPEMSTKCCLWPCVFMCDGKIYVAGRWPGHLGGVPGYAKLQHDDLKMISEFDVVSKHWSKRHVLPWYQPPGASILVSTVLDAVLIGRPRIDDVMGQERFSVFSLCHVSQRLLKITFGKDDQSVQIDRLTDCPEPLKYESLPVYDRRLDAIWLLTRAGELLKYDIAKNVWTSVGIPQIPIHTRKHWEHIVCHRRGVYIAGASCPSVACKIDKYDETTTTTTTATTATNGWSIIDFEGVPLEIPHNDNGVGVTLQDENEANLIFGVCQSELSSWSQCRASPAYFDNRILFICGSVHAIYKSRVYEVTTLTDTIVSSYNPSQHTRQCVATLPHPRRNGFATLLI
jgi:hypothetical protein